MFKKLIPCGLASLYNQENPLQERINKYFAELGEKSKHSDLKKLPSLSFDQQINFLKRYTQPISGYWVANTVKLQSALEHNPKLLDKIDLHNVVLFNISFNKQNLMTTNLIGSILFDCSLSKATTSTFRYAQSPDAQNLELEQLITKYPQLLSLSSFITVIHDLIQTSHVWSPNKTMYELLQKPITQKLNPTQYMKLINEAFFCIHDAKTIHANIKQRQEVYTVEVPDYGPWNGDMYNTDTTTGTYHDEERTREFYALEDCQETIAALNKLNERQRTMIVDYLKSINRELALLIDEQLSLSK